MKKVLVTVGDGYIGSVLKSKLYETYLIPFISKFIIPTKTLFEIV